MTDRTVDDALTRRVVAAIASASVRREAVEFEWPECHKPKCARAHGSTDAAMWHMKHAIIDAVQLELRYESTTRPDVAEQDDKPADVAVFTLAALLNTYNVRHAGTFVRAARMIVEAYPELIPALSGDS